MRKPNNGDFSNRGKSAGPRRGDAGPSKSFRPNSSGPSRPARPGFGRPPSRSAKHLFNEVQGINHADPSASRYDRPRPDRERRERSFSDRPVRVELERLHKYLARCGVASRRSAEALISEGRVEVNDQLVTTQGHKLDPESDIVKVDGFPVQPERLLYYLVNKPKGVVTTLSDPRKRSTIVNYLPDVGVMLRPVGRLDMDTEGLLICTNDGNLADRLTHPKFGVEKEYDVIVKGEVQEKSVKRLREGVCIMGRWTSEAHVELLNYERRTDTTKLKMVIHEGRNRQIRLMCDAVGHPVEELTRVRIGHLLIKGLASGQARRLGVAEINQLLEMSGPDVQRSYARPRPEDRRRTMERERERGERTFGDGEERPQRSFGDREDRPRREFGDRPQRSFGDREDRPRRDFGDRPQRSFGDREDRPRRDFGDRPQRSFGDREDRPRRDFGDRPQRSYGDREDRPRRDFGDRPQRSFGDREDRPRRDSGDRPQRPYGDRPQRPNGDRPQRPYGNRDDRPKRDFGDRPQRPYGDRPQRPSGDRPQRPYGNRDDRPKRDFGDRPQRPYGDRPQRPSGDRPQRPYGNRDDRPKKPYGSGGSSRPNRPYRPKD
ncbi:MAG: pseudouridine synthase [Armatimonadetes bacterium]|nr:pseudouridine synthase [Armatimonadota bacterium]